MMRVLRFSPGGLCLLLLLGSVGIGCHFAASNSTQEVPAPPAWFEDITEKAKLRFIHDTGRLGEYFLPQIMGSGAALFDFNNDDRLDIYLLHNGGPKGAKNRLYQQMPDGSFRDVSDGSGLDIAGYNMGVAVGDINNDGRPDVLVTAYKEIHLFRNNGNGSFTDIIKESGLADPLWSASAAFLDYDRDGWLDLVVVNYLEYDATRRCDYGPSKAPDFCGPTGFQDTAACLFRNLGRPSKDGGAAVRFQDMSGPSGLSQKAGLGLGVVCADFNGDGWPDILVSNDREPNFLWINQRNGTFREEASVRGIAYNGHGMAQANMGIAVGDIDGDSLFDIFITHLTEETNTLWQQGPRGLFKDRTVPAGLAASSWRGTGFGTVMADFNHDGAPDLAIVNGRVIRRPGESSSLDAFWQPYAERNQLFVNEGTGQFRDLSATDPFGQLSAVSRGLACGDIDGDGAPDLLVTTIGGPAHLFRNVAPKEGHWLTVRAIDPAHRRDAYGAVITVRAGGRRWVQNLHPAHSYFCSNDPRVHFGLGAADRVDSIQVRWPDGDSTEETFSGGAVDRFMVLRRGEGKMTKPQRN